jgi:hypothetical protein
MSSAAKNPPGDMSATGAALSGATWVKSTYSGPTGGNCVEVASLGAGEVAVRNSRHPAGPALVFTAAEWDAFTGGVKNGKFG